MNRVVIKPSEKNSYYKECGGKKGYSKKEALYRAGDAAKRGRAKRMGIYQCDFCDKWHLTRIREWEG